MPKDQFDTRLFRLADFERAPRHDPPGALPPAPSSWIPTPRSAQQAHKIEESATHAASDKRLRTSEGLRQPLPIPWPAAGQIKFWAWTTTSAASGRPLRMLSSAHDSASRLSSLASTATTTFSGGAFLDSSTRVSAVAPSAIVVAAATVSSSSSSMVYVSHAARRTQTR
jgi:hypothetical protein